MKVLTAAQMREVDRRTVDLGIPGIILMENAGHRVVEFLEQAFSPLAAHPIVVLCGRGNNGGDGLVVARQLYTRIKPAALHVVLACEPEDLRGDAAGNYRMLRACGCGVSSEITADMRCASLVVDALLGTGLSGPATGPVLEFIHAANRDFPLAKVVAVDLPSGMASDTGHTAGESVRADYTVTFTAPKVGQVLPPGCDRAGRLHVVPIGSPPELFENDGSIFLSLLEAADFAPLLRPRPRGGHKGDFGHVLVIGGSRGKTGAAAMTGMAALRAGAGLVTVAAAVSALPVIAGHAAELMTEALPETPEGAVSGSAHASGLLTRLTLNKAVVAIGPGLGTNAETVEVVRRMVAEVERPMVVDADGLNALAAGEWMPSSALRVLTPHPGEMSRLLGVSTSEVEADRVQTARGFATKRGVILVLKGERTLIGFPDGRVWINPTGTPAMATGGSGDILTGMIAGLLAQFPGEADRAVSAAVYLHGLAAELGVREYGEKSLIARDILTYLPAAIAQTWAEASRTGSR